MAVIVKGKPIKSTLQKAIDYVANAYKTENGILVSTHFTSIEHGETDFMDVWNTNQNTQKKVLARHFKQSFAPGEVTPEEAHQIGLELCEQFLQGEFQFVLGTHVDTDCIHNHILFNNVRMTDYKAYKLTQDIPVIREISDDICREYGLSIIEPDREKEFPSDQFRNTRSYFEDMCLKKGVSWKAKIQSGIDLCIQNSNSYEHFLSNLLEIGLQYDDEEKYLRIKFPEQEKFTRCKEKTLGKDYTRETIQQRIEDNLQLKEKIKNEPPMYMRDPNFSRDTKPKIHKALEEFIAQEKTFEGFIQAFSSAGFSFDPDERAYTYEDEDHSIFCPEIRLKKDYHMAMIQKGYEQHDLDHFNDQFINYKTVNRTKYSMEAAIKHAATLDDFLDEMKKRRYQYKLRHGEMCFKFHSDKEYFTVRPSTFGIDYTPEMIDYHIHNKTLGHEDVRIIKYEKGLNRNEVLLRNMAIMNDSYLLLKKHGIDGFSEVPDAISFYKIQMEENTRRITEINDATEGFLTDPKLKSIVTDLYNENRRLKSTVGNLEKIQGNFDRYLAEKERQKKKEQGLESPTL